MDNKYISTKDTIIALATPFGKSGIGIIKISGDLVEFISEKFFNKITRPRFAELSYFTNPDNKEILDKGILIFFKKPNSFTGEDILEFHGHGSPVMLDYIINIIISNSNIRLALPGEFSSRAFLNGKISLDQSEAILDLIESESIISAKLASKSIQGLFLNKIKFIIKKIINLQTFIETYINFSNENILNLDTDIEKIKNEIIYDLETIIYNNCLNKIIKNGIKIAIIGKPNVGKSTLFNSLINENRSIVSNISGTTRDIINSNIWINGICFNLIDTAGINKTNDIVENLGINKTIEEIYKSDHILYITDKKLNIDNIENLIESIIIDININKKKLYKIPFTIIKNKSDIYNDNIGIFKIKNYNIIYVSAKNNTGINFIKTHFRSFISNDFLNINYLTNNRHVEYINKALYLIKNFDKDLVIYLNNINIAKKSLENIIGINIEISNDILDNIFSKFCIGK